MLSIKVKLIIQTSMVIMFCVWLLGVCQISASAAISQFTDPFDNWNLVHSKDITFGTNNSKTWEINNATTSPLALDTGKFKVLDSPTGKYIEYLMPGAIKSFEFTEIRYFGSGATAPNTFIYETKSEGGAYNTIPVTITEINNSGTYRKYSIKGTILGDNQVYLKLTLATRTNNYNPYVSNLVIDYITPPVAINSYIPVIKDASGDVVEGLVPGGSVSITAVITAYNPLTLIAALYDGNKFIKLGTDYRIVANPSDLNMNVTIDTIPLDVQNPHIKVFLWDNFNSIMPISGWDVKTLQ